MYYKLLKNNISKLNPTITSDFLNDKGINVNMDEAILLTNLAKENWETLFNKNYDDVFKIIKENISEVKYEKLLALYLEMINQYLWDTGYFFF